MNVMVGDGFRVKITIDIPSSGSQKDCGCDGAAYDVHRVGMSPGGRHNRDRKYLENQVIHPAEAGHHCRAGGLPDHI